MSNIIKKAYQFIEDMLPAESSERLSKDAADYWSNSIVSEKLKDLSHWQGTGRWDDKAWRQVGNNHFSMFESFCRLNQKPAEDFKSMIEWGPGGGANALKFSQHFEKIIGVDISLPNLQECQRQLSSINFEGFVEVLIDSQNPKECNLNIEEKVDFFLSTAVFQHFPSKDYGVDVLRKAYDALREGGVAIIQIRYDNDTIKYLSKKRSYKINAVFFTSYKIDEFWSICAGLGFSPIYLKLNTEVNYAYFFLKK